MTYTVSSGTLNPTQLNPAAHAEYTATNVIPPIGAVADVKSLPCHISLFGPCILQGGKN